MGDNPVEGNLVGIFSDNLNMEFYGIKILGVATNSHTTNFLFKDENIEIVEIVPRVFLQRDILLSRRLTSGFCRRCDKDFRRHSLALSGAQWIK